MGERPIKPYIEEKEVILCRSGIQYYTREQLIASGFDVSELPVKDSYAEYRPPAVVVKAKDLFKRLPLTKEHPEEWVDEDNWNKLAGGTTGEEIEVVAINDTDIGLKTTLVFNSKSLYNYYEKGNKEVSVGYLEKREIVKDNPNYDLIMLSIEDVNHCAITTAGRGGKSVAILDSIIGGMRSMKTGLFHFLRRKGKTEDSAAPFSPRVFAALDDAKDKEGEEFEAVVSSVFDSVGCLKDGEQKEHLADMVRDVFSNPTEALENKEELSKILDSVYINISGESIAEIRKALTVSSAIEDSDGKGKNTNNVADTKTEDKNEDSDGKGNADTKTEDKNEDSDGKGNADTKTEETGTKDSIVLTKEDVISIVKSEIASALGTNETKDSITGVDLSSTKDSNIEHLADIADRLFG